MTDPNVASEVLVANVRNLIKTKDGKEVIWEILSMCNTYSYNPIGDLYLEGKRSIGLDILQLLEDADPTFYGRLLIEKQESSNG